MSATEQLDQVQLELRCTICHEFFIQAYTLSCSHSFCFTCINVWAENHNDCPICRQEITSMSPSRALDNMVAAFQNGQEVEASSCENSNTLNNVVTAFNDRLGVEAPSPESTNAQNLDYAPIPHETEEDSSFGTNSEESEGSYYPWSDNEAEEDYDEAGYEDYDIEVGVEIGEDYNADESGNEEASEGGSLSSVEDYDFEEQEAEEYGISDITTDMDELESCSDVEEEYSSDSIFSTDHNSLHYSYCSDDDYSY